MLSENSKVFHKKELDFYLNELSKQYKKLGGKNMPAEIILIGGAAILENYGFRDMTTDVDAIIHAASVMNDAIRIVGERYQLPNGWMNTDFMKTSSYSQKLSEYSVFYKNFNQVLEVRTIQSEYLIAMKLQSGRKYKNDLSDIIGILSEHKNRDDEITYDRIDTAVNNLYGSWEKISPDNISFIQDALRDENYKKIYQAIKESEKKARKILVDFEEQYPGVLKEDNVEFVLEKRQSKQAILDYLIHLNKKKD